MASLEPHSPYCQLNISQRQIRLLRLLPAANLEDPVCAILQVVSLDTQPEYEALSYVWGDPSVREPITFQGKDFLVTVSLALALRYLRYPSLERVVWADALCVNQEDISERSEQIQLMRDIYGGPSAVRIWLGGPDAQDYIAFQIIEQLDQGVELRNINLDGRALKTGDLKALGLLATKPWWNRLWVVQEALVARYATVHAGLHQLNLAALERTCEAIGARQTQDFLMRDRRSVHEDLTPCVQLLDSLAPFSLCRDVQQLRGKTTKAEMLLCMLAATRKLQATDARDKVFAVLGMTMAIPSSDQGFYDSFHWDKFGVTVDYRKENGAVVVYTEVARNMLEFSRNFLVLHHAQPREQEEDVGQLLSWVPIWHSREADAVQQPSRVDIAKIFNAGGGSERAIDFTRCLIAKGIVVDTLTDELHGGGLPLVSCIRFGRPPTEQPLSGFREQLWRTLISDVVPGTQTGTSIILKRYDPADSRLYQSYLAF